MAGDAPVALRRVSHDALYRAFLSVLATKAGQVLSEGQILLDQLLLPVKDAKGQDVTPAERKQQVSLVDDTVSTVQQRKVRCDELTEVRRLKLQQLLQLRTCERDIDQVNVQGGQKVSTESFCHDCIRY